MQRKISSTLLVSVWVGTVVFSSDLLTQLGMREEGHDKIYIRKYTLMQILDTYKHRMIPCVLCVSGNDAAVRDIYNWLPRERD